MKLLTEKHSEFLSLKGAAKACMSLHLSKMAPCWKSHVAAHISLSTERSLSRHTILKQRRIDVDMTVF